VSRLLPGEDLLVVAQTATRLGDLATDSRRVLREYLYRAGIKIASPGAQVEIEAEVAKHLGVLCELLGVGDVPVVADTGQVGAFLSALVDSEGLGQGKLTIEVARNAFEKYAAGVRACAEALAPGADAPSSGAGSGNWSAQRYDLSDDMRLQVAREGRYLYAAAHQLTYHLAQTVRWYQMGVDPALVGCWSEVAGPLLKVLVEAANLNHFMSPLPNHLDQLVGVLQDLAGLPERAGRACAEAADALAGLQVDRKRADEMLEGLVHKIGDIY
jgi:hypothetical protein